MRYQRTIVVFCCVICTAFFLSAPAWAVYLSFTPSDSAIQSGNSVSVDVFISGLENSDLAAFDFNVNFDPAILTFDSYVLGTGLGSIDTGDAENFGLGRLGSGVINIAMFSNFYTMDNQPDTFRLATLTFTGIQEGSSSLVFSDTVFGNEENIAMSVDVNAAALIKVGTNSTNNVIEICRSAEPGRTDPVAQSAGANPLIISGDSARFSDELPANVGVGDVLIYGEQNHAAFIHKRISPSVFTVKTNTGTAPVPISADSSWSIYRAYTSVRDAENGNENTGIPQQLRNFDTWTGGKDLVADNQRWNIACYAGNPDTLNIYVSGWTTGPENYVKIFTPHTPDQVGISQRHNGKWSEDSYRLVTTAAGDYQSSIYIREDYVRIEGLQIHTKANNFSVYGITTNFLNTGNHIYVSDCILKGDSTRQGGGITGYDFIGNITIRNTVVYDMGDVGISASGQHAFEAYNNTVYNCHRGFHVSNPAFIVKNNISAASVNYDYANAVSTESTDNVSSDGSAAMWAWGFRNGITYIVPEEHFVDVEGRDFHLKSTSSLRGRNVGALPE